MNNHQGSIVKRVYLDDVKPLTYEQLSERRSHVEYEKTKFFVNRLPCDIYIRDRSGLLTKIKQRLESRAFPLNHLYVCEQLSCLPEVIESFIEQARQTSKTMQQYTHKVVLQHWVGEPPISSRYSIETQCALSLQLLLDNDGVVYLEDHDLLVMYGLNEGDMSRIHHPYSIPGYAQQSFQQISMNNPHIRRGDFTFNIRIVDNHHTFGNRWLLIGDEAFCVVAVQDKQVTDGIYVTYSRNLIGGTGPQKLLTDRIDFKDSGNLPHYKLYESQQEALLASRGTQETEAKAKIQELESKAAAAENGWKKAQQERDNIERDALHRRQKHEQEMEKLRREQERMQKEHELYLQKQIGESVSVSRKNTMELIKYVPVVISAIACAASLFKKK